MHTVLTCFITWFKVLLKVLVLIIAILFHRVIGIGIGNTFLAWYWYWILQYFLPVLLTTLWISSSRGDIWRNRNMRLKQKIVEKDRCYLGELSCRTYKKVAKSR